MSDHDDQVDQVVEDDTLLSESAFITLEGLKGLDRGHALSNVRNFWPSEAASTEALHKCCMAFKAWKMKPTAENAAALGKARLAFVEAVT